MTSNGEDTAYAILLAEHVRFSGQNRTNLSAADSADVVIVCVLELPATFYRGTVHRKTI